MCRRSGQANQQELHEIKIFFTSYRCYIAFFEAKNSGISIIAMTRAKRHTYVDYFGAENIKIGPANAIVWDSIPINTESLFDIKFNDCWDNLRIKLTKAPVRRTYCVD